MNNQIVLGSGNVYILALPEDAQIPADNELENETNRVGYIKGGASLEYAPEELEIVDDSGVFRKRYVTNEEVTFKSGILTWNLDVLNKICASGSFVDDGEGKRTLKLGGIGAREMKQYIIHFVHTKSDGNAIKITLVATASSGFSLQFASDAETVIDAEFKAVSQDKDGTQVILTETYPVEE